MRYFRLLLLLAPIVIATIIPATFANTKNCAYVEGTLLAKFKSSVALKADIAPTATGITILDNLNTTYCCVSLKPLIPHSRHDDAGNPLRRVYVFSFKTNVTVERLIAVYMLTGLFEYLEPDFVIRGSSSGNAPARYIPNDPNFKRQWALNNDGTFNMGGAFSPKDNADINMPEAWELERGDTSVLIAILDSGCKMDHPELAGRLWRNPGEIPGNGIDDDGNGFVDDVNGWDFIDNDNDPTDKDGHGTAIAGIVGANVNNNIGFAGVNPNAKMLIIRILDTIGKGNTSITVQGIDYAIKMGAKILNLSIGGLNSIQTEHEMIQIAYQKGTIIVGGTGNKNVNKIQYPSAYPEVIGVGATGPDDKRYFFSDTAGSNYGNEIDIVAPGTFIFYLDIIDLNEYGWNDAGTSYATAYVTGVTSLLLAKTPSLTPFQVQDILKKSADDQVGDPAEDTKGWDQYFGWGRLNAYEALALASAITNPRYQPNIATVQSQRTFTFITTPMQTAGTWFTLDGKLTAVPTVRPQRLKMAPGLFIRRENSR